MRIRVEEVMGRDEWQSQHGPMVGWNLRVTTDSGSEDFISLNTKTNNTVTPGQEFDFTPNGQMFGVFKKGKRDQQQSGGGMRQNTPQNAQQRPQSGSSPQQASKPVPTMSQAVAVLSECIEAVAAIRARMPEDDRDLVGPAHVTTLFLARKNGDIRRDPTEAENAAEAAAKAKAAEQAKAAAEAAAAEAAKQAALASMPVIEGGDGEIPFGLFVALGTALHFGSQFIA